uniref:Immunoglobulin subtype domain-containing protein n=1 Tax=Lates calcarifer TaxID=8187 RepID=A0A4W6DX71_LATCA
MLSQSAARRHGGHSSLLQTEVFLRIEPNKLQFFEYDSISLKCEGIHSPAEWKVMRRITSDITECESSTGSLNIPAAFVSHSGEYWCENAEGERSNTVNISVTGTFSNCQLRQFNVLQKSWFCDPGESCCSCEEGTLCDSTL